MDETPPIEVEPTTPPQPQTPAEPPASPSETPPAEPVQQPPSRGWLYRLLNFLFTPETRFGRAMRRIVLWLGSIVGLVSLGLVVGYLLFFQPLDRRIKSLDIELAQAQKQVQEQQNRLKTNEIELGSLQKARDAALSDLAQANAKVDTMLVLVSVNDARLALVKKDGAAAMSALEQAQADLSRAYPVLAAYDKSLAEVIKSRLELAIKELVIDPQAAETDLEKLQADLLAVQKAIFQ